jgi:hypothetical protein
MKPTVLLAAVTAAILAASPARGADLAKIDRTIAKEPVYESKAPKYCLVVLGKEAKTRMWLVIDGKTLYVDRNGDGDLTAADNRVVPSKPKGNVFVTASRPGDKIQFSHLQVRVKDKGRMEISLTRKVDLPHRKKWGRDELMEMAGLTNISFREWMNRDNIEEHDFRFGDRPLDAPIVHFDGPWTLRPMDAKQTFVRGERNRFAVMVGTPGLGKGTFTQVLLLPGDADGVAEISFPNREAHGKPIQVKVALDAPD